MLQRGDRIVYVKLLHMKKCFFPMVIVIISVRPFQRAPPFFISVRKSIAYEKNSGIVMSLFKGKFNVDK